MKLFRYDIELQFVKRSDLIIADALSRDYIDTDEGDETERLRICEVSTFEQFSDARINETEEATRKDYVMQKLSKVITNGWPRKEQIDPSLLPYFFPSETR